MTVTVNSGVDIGSSIGTAALRIGTGWPANCTFKVINKGRIIGPGGVGGAANAGGAGSPGSDGGTALLLDGNPTSVDNDLGYILGGGAGGGGGGASSGGGHGGGGGGGAGLPSGGGGSLARQ